MLPVDQFIEAAGLRLHYLDWGSAEAPAVVLLHGFNQTCHSWDEFAERLAGDGLRAVALDQRGHGDSDLASDGDYGRESMADDVVRLADALGLARFSVLGMSMGAVHAVLTAVRQPERVGALVIVDWSPDVEASGVEVIAQVAQLAWPSFEQAVAAMHRFNPRRSLDNLRARLVHSLTPDEHGVWRWKVDAAGFGRHPRFGEPSDSMWRALGRVPCPTLMVHGAESALVGAGAAARVAAITRGALVTVTGAGHSVAGDNPDGFYAAVAPFLRASSVPSVT